MKRLFPLVLCLSLAVATARGGLIVDHFFNTGNFSGGTEQDVALDYDSDDDGSPPFSETDSRSGTDALGGQRELGLVVNSDQEIGQTTTATIFASGNATDLQSASNTDAEMSFGYGSLAGGGSPLNTDMSAEDRFILGFLVPPDVNAEIFVQLDASSSTFGYTQLLPSGSGGAEIFFSDISGFPAASTDVDGLEFTLRPQDGLTGLDVTLRGIVATTPEPGTLSLLALGGLGLLRRRRRRK